MEPIFIFSHINLRVLIQFSEDMHQNEDVCVENKACSSVKMNPTFNARKKHKCTVYDDQYVMHDNSPSVQHTFTLCTNYLFF